MHELYSFSGFAFVLAAAAAAGFFLYRGVLLVISLYRMFKVGVSAFSVEYAINSLSTGVFFCEEDGYILFCNDKMESLMETVTGTVQRNGRHFYGLLTLGSIDLRCKTTWFEGQNLVMLPDETTWKFSLTEIPIKSKRYFQLTATDITEQWKLTEKLQPQSDELMQRQSELTETIANLHIVSRERETQRAKMRAHDILGERLILLLRAIRNEHTPPDFPLLRSLSQGLLDDLKAVNDDLTPRNDLDILKQIFASIGVDIEVIGSLPSDPEIGQLFADIAREAITNAVRHGLATHVSILMDDPDGDYRLQIANNGHPTKSFREGDGIKGMRKKVEPFGGKLNITVDEQFILTVNLPGGEIA